MWRAFGCLWVLLLAVEAGHAQTGNPASAAPTADTAHLAMQHTPGGVRFVFHKRGTGPLPHTNSRVAVRYTGFLPDGHVFDTTAPSAGPLRFRVGRSEVIAGWDELLPLLPAGSRVRAWIPAALAYGATGVRDPDDDSHFIIPPNTELVFELEVISIR